MEEILEHPQKAAQFFAFIGYTPEQIRQYLIVSLGVPADEATRVMETALANVHQMEAENDITDAEHAAAIAAEFDLGRSMHDV